MRGFRPGRLQSGVFQAQHRGQRVLDPDAFIIGIIRIDAGVDSFGAGVNGGEGDSLRGALGRAEQEGKRQGDDKGGAQGDQAALLFPVGDHGDTLLDNFFAAAHGGVRSKNRGAAMLGAKQRHQAFAVILALGKRHAADHPFVTGGLTVLPAQPGKHPYQRVPPPEDEQEASKRREEVVFVFVMGYFMEENHLGQLRGCQHMGRQEDAGFDQTCQAGRGVFVNQHHRDGRIDAAHAYSPFVVAVKSQVHADKKGCHHQDAGKP